MKKNKHEYECFVCENDFLAAHWFDFYTDMLNMEMQVRLSAITVLAFQC